MIALEPLRADAFAPFGTVTEAPNRVGERAFLTEHLGGAGDTTARLHVNCVAPVDLPFDLTLVERHPHACQIFLPVDVARYVVVVMPSGLDGAPLTGRARAFLSDGQTGIVYARNVWHAPSMVLDRVGHFAVLMWRGEPDDDVFQTLAEPLRIGT